MPADSPSFSTVNIIFHSLPPLVGFLESSVYNLWRPRIHKSQASEFHASGSEKLYFDMDAIRMYLQSSHVDFYLNL